jgi:hypothetical protein
MSSEADISNIALSNLGSAVQITSITPPDGSRESDLCARFYPVARRMMYTADYNWSWTIQRAALVAVAGEDVSSWAYAYAAPNNMVRVAAVLPEGYTRTTRSVPYSVEASSTGSRIIRTNIADAQIKYTIDVTNAGRFSGSFTIAIARRLSSLLAGPLIKGLPGAKVSIEQMKLFQVEWGTAVTDDANQSQDDTYDLEQSADLRFRT